MNENHELSNDLSNNIRCDIYEKDKSYVIEMDVPGFKKTNVGIGFNDGYLTVSGRKEEEKSSEKRGYVRQERRYGSFERQFYIGKVKQDKIDASFHDGVLKIIIPKVDDNRNLKNIKIK